MTAPSLLRPLLVCVALALVATSCTGGSPAATPTAGGPGRSPVPTTELRIAGAPYSLPAPVQREVAVADGSTIYLAGGLDSSDSSVGGVFSLNGTTGHVTTLGSMPNVFHDAAGAVMGGKLVVFGGGSSEGSRRVQTFDPATKTGAVTGHLPVALSDLAAAVVGNTVYLVGGYDGKTPRAEIYATTDGRRFSTVATLPEGLRYAAVTAVGTTVVIAGGQTATGQSDKVIALDTTTGKLSTLGTLSAPISEATAFTLGDSAYVVGGRDAAGRAVAGVVRVDPSTGRISRAGRLPRPVADAPAIAVGESALIIGGWRGSAVTDVVQASLVPVVADTRTSTAAAR